MKTSTFEISYKEIAAFSLAVTNGWYDEMDQPQKGLVYLSSASFGARWRCNKEGTPLGELSKALIKSTEAEAWKAQHKVKGDFGNWLGYKPSPLIGFGWESCSGSTATAVPFKNGYKVTLSSSHQGDSYYERTLKSIIGKRLKLRTANK